MNVSDSGVREAPGGSFLSIQVTGCICSFGRATPSRRLVRPVAGRHHEARGNLG
jgi:hypothetical protein